MNKKNTNTNTNTNEIVCKVHKEKRHYVLCLLCKRQACSQKCKHRLCKTCCNLQAKANDNNKWKICDVHQKKA